MNPSKISILFNPSAGKGKAIAQKSDLEACLRNLGIAFDLFVTAGEDELKTLAGDHSRTYETVVGAGGDSTFHLIANEILKGGYDVRLGFIPLGSSNDIAMEFGQKTMRESCSVLKSGRTRRIDAGGIIRDGRVLRYFIGQANIGLGALVNMHMEALAKRRPRFVRRQALAGALSVLNAMHSGKLPYSLAVESEEGFSSGEFLLAVFSNIRYWATGKIIAPGAEPDDGFLDASLLEPCSFARLARISRQLGKGGGRKAREIRVLRSRSFEIASGKPFEIQTDGEILGGPEHPQVFDKITLKAFPGILKIVA